MKLDDDLAISSSSLQGALVGAFPWALDTLYCYPLRGVTPQRRTWGQHAKLAVPLATFPHPVYPDYCLGWVVVATLPTAEALLQQVGTRPNNRRQTRWQRKDVVTLLKGLLQAQISSLRALGEALTTTPRWPLPPPSTWTMSTSLASSGRCPATRNTTTTLHLLLA